MTKEELATKLNGRQYREGITRGEGELAKENGLVIVYGASDNLMEFAGAIDDEIGCYDGGSAYLNEKGLITNKCDDNNCPYYQKEIDAAKKISANWGRNDYSWTYETDIPHTTFEIVEDSDKYCKGIIFDLKDASPQST